MAVDAKILEYYARKNKWLNAFVIVNFFVMICAVILIILSVWANVDKGYLQNITEHYIFVVGTRMLIAFAIVLLALPVIGFLGAYKEWNNLLTLYVILCLIAGIFIFVSGMLAFIYMHDVEIKVRHGMERTISKYGIKKQDVDFYIKTSWDIAQTEMKCCGIDDFEDWTINNDDFDFTDILVPKSCCSTEIEKIKCNDTKECDKMTDCARYPSNININEKGCLLKVAEILFGHSLRIGCSCIATCMLMLFALIVCLLVINSVSTEIDEFIKTIEEENEEKDKEDAVIKLDKNEWTLRKKPPQYNSPHSHFFIVQDPPRNGIHQFY